MALWEWCTRGSSGSLGSIWLLMQGGVSMPRLRARADEIKAAIEALPEGEYVQLRQWFADRDWEN